MTSGAFQPIMDCYDFMQHVDTFVDGELEMSEHSAMEEHSRVCADCNEKEARRRNTRQRLRATAQSEAFQPSMDFMARLQSAIEEKSASPSMELRLEQIADEKQQATTAVREAPNQTLTETRQDEATHDDSTPRAAVTRFDALWEHWKLVALAAAALVALGVGLSTMTHSGAKEDAAMVAGTSSFASPVVGESVAWHRRSVPVEVVGPDPNAVRRWFSDKVSFAVTIPEIDGPARLLGGRLSHVRQYEAAYLLYEVNGSKLSVMLFDAGDLEDETNFSNKTFVDNSNGYNVAIREKSGVTYTFTSDMNAEELADLVDGTMTH